MNNLSIAGLRTTSLLSSSSFLLAPSSTRLIPHLHPWTSHKLLFHGRSNALLAGSPQLPLIKSSSPLKLSSPSLVPSFTLGRPSSSITVLCKGPSNAQACQFHATPPARAAHGAFRLAHFVAPLVMRVVKGWIGTPKTNKYFYYRLIVAIALILGLPVAYIVTHLEAAPYTDRLRFVALTSDDEKKLGEMAFNQLIEEHETDFIPDHHRFVANVTEVATRIIQASNRPDIKWEVRLIDSPIPNAFAIPGGKIFVFSGLLGVTQNDDGLAFILGHEVAHVLARHGAEQMTVGRIMLGVSVLLSALFGDNVGSFLMGRVISLLTELQYSRNMEREADYIGLMLMHNAKYDISEAPRVWQRMMQQTGDDGEASSFLSTHPSHGDRITDITRWVNEIKQEGKPRPISNISKQ